MKQNIQNKLIAIENEYNIKILYACETGSRAWGFPSPDSDYDVRMIYVHKEDWYLGLSEKRDVIELMLDDGELDITGWDLRKSLRLLTKSNASFLERIQSPIVYRSDAMFMEELKELSQPFFSPITTIYHYFSMANTAFATIKGKETTRLKTLFYALRATTACKWILDKKTMPPIIFMDMINELEVDEQVCNRINILIDLKASKSEAYLHSEEMLLVSFIEEQLTLVKEKAKNLSASKGDVKELDQFLYQTIKSQ